MYNNFVFNKASNVGPTDPHGVQCQNHTIQALMVGDPTTLTVRLEGDITGLGNWVDMSGSMDLITNNLMFQVQSKPVLAVRVNVLSLAGGTAPYVYFYYTGAE